MFLLRWRSKGPVGLKLERCKHRHDTSIVDGDQEGVKCYLFFVLKDQVKKVPSLGRSIKLCQCSSCVGGLRSLLNTEGILTLPMFLLGDGCLMHMLSDSFLDGVGCCCLCLLFSVYSAFWCFVEILWFLMALLVGVLWRCHGF